MDLVVGWDRERGRGGGGGGRGEGRKGSHKFPYFI